MTHALIKDNIKRLLKEKNWKVATVENQLGSGRVITSILRGNSKNPTIEVLQSIANAFNVEVQDLLNEQDTNDSVNPQLLKDACTAVLNEISNIPQTSPKPSLNTIFGWIKEIYQYSIHMNKNEIDLTFTQWVIQRNFKA